MRKMRKAQYEFWQEKATKKEPRIPCGLSQAVLMVMAYLLGQLVCSDRGMWPLAVTASMGAESRGERCTVPAAAEMGHAHMGTLHAAAGSCANTFGVLHCGTQPLDS